MKTKNPASGRQIDVGGPSFNKLIKEGYTYNSETNTLTKQETHIPKVAPVITPVVQRVTSIPTTELDFTPLTSDDLVPRALDINFKPELIVHISDIHIPVNLHIKRHDEYTKVFENLYEKLSMIKKPMLLAVTGDLVNTKLRTDNETLIMAQKFLTKLSSIAPTIVIIGNHDFAENNLERTDSIEAICYSLPKIHVLKHTGIYTISGMYFVFNSLFDLKFIHRKDVNTNLPVYALYHGSLVGASMDNGTLVKSPRNKKYPTLADFEGFDAVLLGHIHKFQKVRPHIAYAGSLIQQNFGETVEHHGMLLWNTMTHTSEHIEVDNPYAYVTVTVDDGRLMPIDEEKLKLLSSKKLRIRYCKTHSTTPSQQDALEKRLNETYSIIESAYKALDVTKVSEVKTVRDNIITLETELDLITEMCNDVVRDQVLTLHKSLHVKSSVAYNVWRPLSLEFKNVFIYGNDHINKINFVNGVTDICAPNTHGKSSIVYALIFALYDRISMHSDRKTDILHKGSSNGYIILTFVCNGQVYDIRKNIAVTKGTVTYKTQFHKVDESGRILLNGTSETGTIREIEKYVGKLPQFINNNLISTKQGSSSILSMGQTEQTKHFHTVCNLAHYEDYLTECKKKHKGVKESLLAQKALHQSLQLQLASLDKAKIQADINESRKIELLVDSQINDLRLVHTELVNQRATVQADVNTLGSCLVGFNRGSKKEDLVDSLTMVTSQLESYTFEQRIEASKWSIALLEEQVRKVPKRVSLDISEISEINENIVRLESDIKAVMLVKPDIDRDTANQKLGSLRDQLRDKGSMIRKYEGYLTPGIVAEVSVLTEEQSLLERQLHGLEVPGYTVRDIGHLQSLVDGFVVTGDRDTIVRDHLLVKDQLAVAIHRGKEFRGDMKATDLVLSQLSSMIKKPVHVDSMRSLPRNHLVRVRELESKVNTVPKDDSIRIIDNKKYVPLDESQIFVIDDSNFIPIDINDSYVKLDHQKSLYEELERLRNDISHNDSVSRAIETNINIEKYNSDIYAQIQWLQHRDITNEIAILVQKDKDITSYLAKLDAHGVLTKLLEYAEVQRKLDHVVEQLTLVDYQMRVNSLKLEIEEITAQLAVYNSVLQWYHTCEQLQRDLTTYTSMRDDYNEMTRYTQLREYHSILKLIATRDRIESQLAMWDKVTELHSLRVTLDEIESKLVMVNERLREYEETLTAERRKIVALDRDISDFSVLQDSVNKCNTDILDLELQCAVYTEYERLFNTTGIPSVLLSRGLKLFSDRVNDIFQKYTKYSFDCTLENTGGQKQKVDIVIHNRTDDTELEYTRLSGFESVLLNIALNKAILDIDTSFHPGIFIIDESLDCIDQDRFIRCLPTIFNVLKSHFNTILVISHRDIPRDIIDSKIAITNNGSYSMIE